jgi:hypothetical protein
MDMKVNELRKLIDDCFTPIYFQYKGEWGNIEPCYDKKTGYTFDCYYGGVDQRVYNIDDAMNLQFVDGKSLNELAEQLEDVDW